MTKQNLLYSVAGIIIGIIIATGGFVLSGKIYESKTSNPAATKTTDNHSHQTDMTMDMNGAMNGMMSGLNGKTGDEFDEAFLKEMITHHQGAVDMANAALKDAKHTEIKTLATGIISAQTKEITQMQDWLKDWYKK